MNLKAHCPCCGHYTNVYTLNGVERHRTHDQYGDNAFRSGCNGSDKPVITAAGTEATKARARAWNRQRREYLKREAL